MSGYYKKTLWIVAAGVALRLVVCLWLLGTPLFGDAYAYHYYATMYLEGSWFETIRAPGLPLWLAACYRLFGTSQLVAMLSIMPFHLLLSAAVFFFTLRRFHPRAALIALALISFYPAMVLNSILPLTQIPVAAALAVCIYFLDGRQSWLRIIAGAIFLSFAIIVRPNSIILVPVLALLLLFKRRYSAGAAATFVAVALLPALLWSVREYRHSGDIVFINYTNSMNFYLGNNRYTPLYKTWWFGSHGEGDRDVPPEFSAQWKDILELPVNEQNGIYKKLARQEILSRPGVFLIRTLSRIRTLFAFDVYTGMLVIKRIYAGKATGAVVLGLDLLFYIAIMSACLVFYLGRRVRQQTGKAGIIIPVTILAYAFPFWLAFSHPTYHLPLMPLFAVPAGAAIAQISSKKPFRLGNLGLNWRLNTALAIIALIQIEWIFAMSASFLCY